MPKVRVAFALPTALALTAFVGCSSDGSAADDVGVSQDLLIVGAGFEKDVTVFDDHLELPLAGHEGALETPAGKLLVGGPSQVDRNPHGFLRRASGVRAVGDRIVIDTTRPVLTDVFHGSAQVGVQGASGDATTGMSAAGTLRPAGWASTIGGLLKLPAELMLLSTVVGYVDPIKSNETFDVQVKLAGGSFSFQPKVTTDVKVKSGELDHLLVSAEGQMQGELEIDLDVKAQGTLTTTQSGLLRPLRVDRRLVQWHPAHALQFIGGVPVWETIELALALHCDIALNGEASAKLIMKVAADGIYGAEYRKNQGWSAIKKAPDLDPSGSRVDLAQIGDADIKCSLEPQVALLVYDLAGPTLALGPYANVHVDEKTRAWSLQPGFRADVGVLITFASYQVGSERYDIVDVPLGAPFTGGY
jgi:hypothetical protein